MPTNEWKPVYLKLSGDRQKSASFRRFAEKLLAQSKERNEQLGNYPNPVHRYKSAEVRITTRSLPGYDIIEIETPTAELREPLSEGQLYSGLFESRYNPAGVAWYMRYYPAEYEVFNNDQFILATPGASIDGAEDYIDPPMPPLRWMYNDYDGDPEEMPWFDQKFLLGPVAGRFSGKLRKLVQLQLGMNMAVGFGYSGGNCNGLRVEELSGGRKRLWLYKIGGGVFMQHMYDYTEEGIQKKAGWTETGVPPEITNNGWFTLQTEWDDDREVWDRAVWEATNPASRPSLGAVTFQLLDADTVNNATAGYYAQGDYGWSFNSDCTSAVFVGMGWNTDVYPAVNYQSQFFEIVIYENHATIDGTGKSLFVHDPKDSLKVPDSIGRLITLSWWRTQTGAAASQPASSYSAPQYAFYDLNDDLQLVTYEYSAGTVGDINGNHASSQWGTAFANCATVTAYAPTNFSYQNCGYGEFGYGTDGRHHGFNTSVLSVDTLTDFVGWEGTWSAVAENTSYRRSGWVYVLVYTFQAPAFLQWSHHALSQVIGTFSEYAYNCVIVPSFERLGLYHYKQFRRIVSSARRAAPVYLLYERGSPVYTGQCFCISGCSLSTCSVNSPADHHPEREVGNYAWVTSSNDPCSDVIYSQWDESCIYDGSSVSCWTSTYLLDCPGSVNVASAPAAQNPYTEDNSTYSGILLLPDASVYVFTEDDILNQSRPFRESSEDYGWQDVVSAFDDFSGRWVFSQPEVWISGTVTNSEYPTDMIKSWVGWVGDPGYGDL